MITSKIRNNTNNIYKMIKKMKNDLSEKTNENKRKRDNKK